MASPLPPHAGAGRGNAGSSSNAAPVAEQKLQQFLQQDILGALQVRLHSETAARRDPGTSQTNPLSAAASEVQNPLSPDHVRRSRVAALSRTGGESSSGIAALQASAPAPPPGLSPRPAFVAQSPAYRAQQGWEGHSAVHAGQWMGGGVAEEDDEQQPEGEEQEVAAASASSRPSTTTTATSTAMTAAGGADGEVEEMSDEKLARRLQMQEIEEAAAAVLHAERHGQGQLQDEEEDGEEENEGEVEEEEEPHRHEVVQEETAHTSSIGGTSTAAAAAADDDSTLALQLQQIEINLARQELAAAASEYCGLATCFLGSLAEGAGCNVSL